MSDVINSSKQGKYLTLNLGEEFYGISVKSILQIIAIPEITSIPNTPDFVKGVINLRGRIIPLIDLRLKFNLEEKAYNARTSIIIIKFEFNDRMIFIGTVVDKVSEVMDIQDAEIEEKPDFGINLNTQFILGIAKLKERVVTLLNIEEILTQQELTTLQRKSNESKTEEKK